MGYIYKNKKDSYVNFFLGLVEEQRFYWLQFLVFQW